MVLLVDIGNTRVKWALLDAGRLRHANAAVHRGSPDAVSLALEQALPGAGGRIIVANVAGEPIAQRLRELAARRGATVELITTTTERFGVRCGYVDPNRLGVDRWVAILAAHRAARGPTCVVQAGTAVTFDAVDSAGTHLGGLIWPGPRLLAAVLDRNTSEVGATTPAATAPMGLDLLGKSTNAAVGHGAMLALAAALDRAVRTVAQAFDVTPVVYLTGGDAAVLQGWLETEVQLRADLVLEGLALFAAASASLDLAGS